MKIIRKIYHWCTKTRLRKILSLTLAILIFLTSIKYIFTPAPPAKAADIYLGMNEGYGTSSAVHDTNSTISAGSITNATWKSEEYCKVGKCLYFDGSGDYVSFTDSASLDMAATDTVTLEAWFRTPDITSGSRSIISKYETTGADGGYRVYINSSGQVVFGIDSNNTSFPLYSVTSTNAYDDNTWHFIAGVKDGTSSMTLYIDGNQVGTTSIASTAADNNDSFYIGRYQSDTAQDFSGFIDEVKVLRSARSAAEIKTDYAGETPTRGTSVSFGPTQDYLSNGLIGYWKMDESSWTNNCSTGSVLDYSGNGNNAASCPNTTGPTGAASGYFGNAGSFDGTDDYVITSSTTIYDNLPQFTASAWVKSNTSSYAAIARIMSKATSGTSGWYLGWDTTNRLRLNVDYDGANDLLVRAFTLSANTWYHVAVTWNGSGTAMSNVKLYLNGAEATSYVEQTDGVGNRVSDTTPELSIGMAGNGTTGPFNGYIDEARIYSRILSPTEIQNLYNWAPGPKMEYKFDEGTGQTIQDTSTSGSSGTRGGSTSTETVDPQWSSGKFGSSLNFENNADYAILSTLTPTKNMTIEGWVYPKNVVSGSNYTGDIIFGTVQTKGCCTWPTGIGFFDSNFAAGTATDGGVDASWNTLQGTATYTANNWYHVAMTINGTSRKLYVNGVLDNSDTLAETVLTASSTFVAGSNYVSASYSTQLDDLKYYDYARSPSQIVEDMNGSHPSPGSPIGSATSHWSFDEGYGTTAHDDSINANNLTLSTASWTNSAKFGKAFNGLTNVRASRADDNDLDFAASDDFSLSVWFKSDSATNPTANEYLLEKGGSVATPAIGYAIYTASSGGTICFGIDDDAVSFPEDSVCSTNDLYDNTWHHIVATKTGTSRLDLYVDGIANGTPDTSISATGTLANAATFYIGDTNGTDGTDEFLGDIDEVKIYRLAMSADQVKVEYNQGSATVMGVSGTTSTGSASNSDTDSYCPPGQGSTCTPPLYEWKMDENSGTTLNDTGTNSVNMTKTNNPPWVPGKHGSGLSFDGSTQETATSTSPTGIADSFTAETWIYPRAIPVGGSYHTFFDSFFYFELTNNTEMDCGWSGGTEHDTTTAGITLNTWHHVACVFDNTANTVKIYLDGKEITSQTENTVPSSSAITWYLGNCHSCGSNQHLNGNMDETRLYNYARTPAQIAWGYSRGAPLGYWQMDENVSGNNQTIYDASGNSFNGTTNYGANTTGMDCTVTGKINKACNFDGVDDYVNIPYSATLTPTSNFSVSFWWKPASTLNSGSSTHMSLVSKSGGSSDANNDWSVFFLNAGGDLDQGRLRFGTYGGNIQTNTSTWTAGTWYHILVSYTSSTNVTIYVNGIADNYNADFDAGAIDGNLSNPIMIGRGYECAVSCGLYYANETIDDLRIYNYAMNATQAKMIMNDGSAVKFTQ